MAKSILFAILCTCVVASAWATNPPKWEKVHTVSGVLYIPYAEIAEPFYAWHDGVLGRSRIDFYGGMVKTYQLTERGRYGSLLKVAPVTTEEEVNKMTCLETNGTVSDPIQIQSVLPETKDFVLVGNEEFDGDQCDKFMLEEVIGKKTNKYLLWVKYRSSPKYPASRMAIPVRYEMRGFNNVFGSHYDHYYMTFDMYDHEDIDEEIFEVPTKEPCVGFPGPGIRHYTTFNPMREFVHPRTTSHVDDEFHRFRRKHRKSYATHEVEKRHMHFMHNLRYIRSKNRARLGYTLGVNHLTDRSEDELRALRGYRPSKPANGNGAQPFPYSTLDIYQEPMPDQLDWRIRGAVTPVKDQSVCGSCWSFGTVGAIEGAYYMKTKNLVRFSQQALIDCSWGFGNNGCDGGEDFRVYQWMKKHGGIPSEEEYGPYLGQDGYCHIENVTLLAPITDYVNVTANDVGAMKLALFKHGPISVAIDASPRSFSFYADGVYYEPKCRNDVDGLDHAVLAVGYGTLDGEFYWLVKNSWSNYWGLQGYILMAAKDNNCGVMTMPTYVTME